MIGETAIVDKAPDAYRTISEVAADLDLPQHVLRFWESRFPQIKPLKRGGGRRFYRPDDVDLVRGIKHLLHGTGYTIRGVQRIFKDEGVKFVQSVGRTGAIPAKALPSLSGAETEAAKTVLVSPLKERPIDLSVESGPPRPGSAEDLAALIAPRLTRAPSRGAKRNKEQLGLFGEAVDDGDPSSPQAVARMLPSAWRGASLSHQLTQKLQAVLTELEECGRLISTARIVAREASR